jgi:signal transduction histidine kinase
VQSLSDALQYVNLAAFAGLAFVCFVLWRRRGGRAAFWAFATFGLLALVAIASLVNDAVGHHNDWAAKTIVALIVFFPYFLYRFAATFAPPRREVEWLALTATSALAVWALTLPEVPQEGEPRAGSFLVLVVALLVQWTALSLYVALRLWRAGRRQPTVVRYRMRLLAVGAVALSIVLILAGAAPTEPPAWFDLTQQLLTLASTLLFFVGFTPPKAVRRAWREPEEDVLRRSVDELLLAGDPEHVTRTVLPLMAHIVGARAVALLDGEGRVLGSHGIEADEVGSAADAARLELASGTVLAWTSAYAPFFAQEEFELLHSLGGFALIAYERSRLFAQEREALRQADQLKSNFIALASHELRTPASVIHGVASTLHLRGDELSHEQVSQLERTLYEQTDRMRLLVDQLLDLSRLEADGVRIRPEPVPVLGRVQEILLSVAGDHVIDVELDIPAELEALADPQAFERVVSNLVVNAFRYGAPPVTISAEQRDRHFRLTVEDRGAGVPAEFVPELFERFSRSGRSRDTPGGAGLGLAIAQSYAQAHGGELFYEPARPRGARFQLVLPQPLPDHS